MTFKVTPNNTAIETHIFPGGPRIVMRFVNSREKSNPIQTLFPIRYTQFPWHPFAFIAVFCCN